MRVKTDAGVPSSEAFLCLLERRDARRKNLLLCITTLKRLFVVVPPVASGLSSQMVNSLMALRVVQVQSFRAPETRDQSFQAYNYTQC